MINLIIGLILPLLLNLSNISNDRTIVFNNDNITEKTINYKDYSEYREKVMEHECNNMYWYVDYSGGSALGAYQIESSNIPKFNKEYSHLNPSFFYSKGYSFNLKDSLKKELFDLYFPLEIQNEIMDSLTNYNIDWIEKNWNGYGGKPKPILEICQELSEKYGFEITDAMIAGGAHYTWAGGCMYRLKSGNIYSALNAYGYTLFACMTRYKGIWINRTKKITLIEKIEPLPFKFFL